MGNWKDHETPQNTCQERPMVKWISSSMEGIWRTHLGTFRESRTFERINHGLLESLKTRRTLDRLYCSSSWLWNTTEMKNMTYRSFQSTETPYPNDVIEECSRTKHDIPKNNATMRMPRYKLWQNIKDDSALSMFLQPADEHEYKILCSGNCCHPQRPSLLTTSALRYHIQTATPSYGRITCTTTYNILIIRQCPKLFTRNLPFIRRAAETSCLPIKYDWTKHNPDSHLQFPDSYTKDSEGVYRHSSYFL